MNLEHLTDAELEARAIVLRHEIQHCTVGMPRVDEHGNIQIAVPLMLRVRANLLIDEWWEVKREQIGRRFNKAEDVFINEVLK